MYMICTWYIYGIHHWRIPRSSYRKLAWVGFEPTNRLSYQAMSSSCSQIQLCTAFIFHTTFISLLSVHVSFRSLPSSVATFVNHVVAEWIYTYGIHHWRIPRSSYRKLAWVGFEPTTTEFCSEGLTDWAIKPWVQLTPKANFV